MNCNAGWYNTKRPPDPPPKIESRDNLAKEVEKIRRRSIAAAKAYDSVMRRLRSNPARKFKRSKQVDIDHYDGEAG